VLEILRFQPGPDESRVQWALPASVEVQREGWRAFGSAGYFSRGALFAAAGGELALSDRAWLVGAITQSHSARTDNLSAALGFAKTRTDVSAGLTVAATPAVAVFGSVGRTISREDDNSARLSVTAGVSYSFTAWKK
jgi:outer membrane autotransporter protein